MNHLSQTIYLDNLHIDDILFHHQMEYRHHLILLYVRNLSEHTFYLYPNHLFLQASFQFYIAEDFLDGIHTHMFLY